MNVAERIAAIRKGLDDYHMNGLISVDTFGDYIDEDMVHWLCDKLEKAQAVVRRVRKFPIPHYQKEFILAPLDGKE